jgi:hypothetical protein
MFGKVIDLALRAKDEGNLSKRGNGFNGVRGLMGGLCSYVALSSKAVPAYRPPGGCRFGQL